MRPRSTSTASGWPRWRGGLLPRRLFLALLGAVALAGPLVVFRETVRRPLTHITCGRPVPNERLGDPVIVLSVMGRAWSRWDRGDLSRRDDRVFAPYPDTWPLGEPFVVPALVGYPFARLGGSLALGYNVPYLLAAVVAAFAAGLLLADLAGPGWAALGGALLFAWCPGRLNNFGVLGTVWGGFVPLVLLFALRFLSRGRPRDAVLAGVALAAVGLGSPYPLAMGTVVTVLVAVTTSRDLRRLALLGASLGTALAFLAVLYFPYLRIGKEFDAPVGGTSIEGHAADLLSLLHTGLFAGPLRDLLDPLVPGFPEGASACFPTVTALAALLAGALLLRRAPRQTPNAKRPGRSLAPWLLLALTAFACALGPTVRLAGEPLGPGPYRLLAALPGFSGMRGIHRWDQWLGLGLVAAATLVLGRLLRVMPRRRALATLAAFAPLLALDVWPRHVPAQPVPGPSPFDAVYRALPRDAIVAVYPFHRLTSERAWAEQLAHGRRLVNGYQTYPTPIHAWLSTFGFTRPFEATFTAFAELGASAVEVDLAALPQVEAARIDALLSRGRLPRVRAAARAGTRRLLLLEPVAPLLVDPRTLSGLRFEGTDAVVAASPGRLVFRLGSEKLDVVVADASGTRRDVLRVPVVASESLVASLSRPLPRGAVVRTADGGREIGRSRSSPTGTTVLTDGDEAASGSVRDAGADGGRP